MQTSLPLKLVSISALALALVACNKQDDVTAANNPDPTLEERTDLARADIRESTAEATADAKAAAANVGTAVEDATITAKVKAELAKDDTLNATDINVDTKDGKVHLQGTAPSAEARERASRLATNVEGVIQVDNELRVGSSS